MDHTDEVEEDKINELLDSGSDHEVRQYNFANTINNRLFLGSARRTQKGVNQHRNHKGDIKTLVQYTQYISNIMCNKSLKLSLRLDNLNSYRTNTVLQKNKILDRKEQKLHYETNSRENPTTVEYSENRNQESVEPEAFPKHSDIEVQDHQYDADHQKDVRTEHSTTTPEYSYILLFLFFYYSIFPTCTFFYICKISMMYAHCRATVFENFY